TRGNLLSAIFGELEPFTAARLTFRRRDLAGFHEALEVAEVGRELLFEALTEQSERLVHDLTRWRTVFDRHPDHRAAVAFGESEADVAARFDVAARKRAPGDALVLAFVGDLRLPPHLSPEGSLGDPVGLTIVQHVHGFDVAKDLGEIVELPPKTIEVLGGTLDRERLDDVHAVLVVAGTIDSQGAVSETVAGDPPREKARAESGRDDSARPLPSRESHGAERGEPGSGGGGDPALGATHVDGQRTPETATPSMLSRFLRFVLDGDDVRSRAFSLHRLLPSETFLAGVAAHRRAPD